MVPYLLYKIGSGVWALGLYRVHKAYMRGPLLRVALSVSVSLSLSLCLSLLVSRSVTLFALSLSLFLVGKPGVRVRVAHIPLMLCCRNQDFLILAVF